MRICAVLAVFLAPLVLFAQGLTPQKSLNNISAYADQSAQEIGTVVKALADYYQDLAGQQSFRSPRFVCPVQPEEYYLKKAKDERKGLGSQEPTVLAAFEDLVNAGNRIDEKCKSLDTYHKLEEYKSDSYARGRSLVNEMLPLFDSYRKKQYALFLELLSAHKKLYPGSHSYQSPVQMMIRQLTREGDFLDQFKYNLSENTHTGWNVALFEKSILETDAEIKKMEGMKPVFKYPASSMWPSFIEGMKSILELKRNGLDGYNHDARKSDHHSNSTYLNLINYYNGVLVAHYNALIDYASNDQFHGLKAFRYVPVAEVRDTQEEEHLQITPFRDATVSLPAITPAKAPISKTVYGALENYVTFINETYRQVSHERDVIRNLSSSASYYSTLTSFSGRGGIQFRHEGFAIPLSAFQKASAESGSLAAPIASVLNQEAKVILDILKEMDQIGLALEREAASKAYEKDQCRQMYAWIERMKILYETWDAKKEKLHRDVRAIYDSYPATSENPSWVKSGTALWHLTKADLEGLFTAKNFYKTDNGSKPSVDEINKLLRDALSDEYENMKGIEKLGRYNGRCPYTPYEDLPKISRYLSEALAEMKPASANRSSEHPYHRMVYHYNDIARHYNKFSELSLAPLLKTVYQPELFEISYPKPEEVNQPTVRTAAEQTRSQTVTPAVTGQSPHATQTPVRSPDEKDIKLIRDTIYIERRDTVYLKDTDENYRSMEGYAANNLVLLLDVSGSMNAPEKLPLLKKSVLDLVSMMRNEDEISIVVFSGKPGVLLKPLSFRQEDKIRKAIQSLKPSGKTDANGGIRLAYKLANDNYIRGGNNRIILATDGEFSLTDESKKLIAEFSRQDIYLSVFNFGKAVSTSANLKELAVTGQGTYQFISKENVEQQLIREVKAKRKH